MNTTVTPKPNLTERRGVGGIFYFHTVLHPQKEILPDISVTWGYKFAP